MVREDRAALPLPKRHREPEGTGLVTDRGWTGPIRGAASPMERMTHTGDGFQGSVPATTHRSTGRQNLCCSSRT